MRARLMVLGVELCASVGLSGMVGCKIDTEVIRRRCRENRSSEI